jgi:mitochondrial import receptor subunit TOM20
LGSSSTPGYFAGLLIKMSSQSAFPRWSTIAALTVGTVLTGFVGYAIYFDHRRRTDPEFRKALKRESKKQQKEAKQQAEAAGAQQKKSIREAVDKVNEEGFPTEAEEVEKYFMDEVAEGELLCQSRTWSSDQGEFMRRDWLTR